MATQNRRLPLLIDAETYRALESRGKAAERDPVQQARYELRRALGTLEPADEQAATAVAPK